MASMSKICVLLFCSLPQVLSYVPVSTSSISKTALNAKSTNFGNKREFLEFAAKSFTATVSSNLIFGEVNSASASLLDDYGSGDFKNFDVKKEVAPAGGDTSSKKGEFGVDPTLRANYYYPTAKKRYLPRIKKVSDEIAEIPTKIQNDDWEAVGLFANKVADDAILPMKLYQSSLDGQGLHMANSYVAVMKKDAEMYEKQTKDLQAAVKSKNKDKAVNALAGMSESLSGYRVAGRLTGPEGGGDIPSVEEMRRMAMRRPTTAVAKK